MKWFNKSFPQNYILRRPVIGTIIFSACCFGFLVLYQPLGVHQARSFSLGLTMAFYCCIMAIPVFGVIKAIKKIPGFSDENEWTILKEIFSIVFVLLGMGIAIYFAGFLIEAPSQRWNLATFVNSCFISFMLGIPPLAFFTVINYRHLVVTETTQNFNRPGGQSPAEPTEKLLNITSQLKKETLQFYPSQLIYAESSGNYVIFYLKKEGQVQQKMIRNSISNIEQQLSGIPFLMRVHRAFIVNVKEIVFKKGNSLGYRIKLNGIETAIPVSRQHTKDFEQLLKAFR